MAPSDELEVDESSPARAVPCPWAMRADLPTGTVAFLFTDIEARRGSCTLSGPRRTHALAEHRRVLREAVAAGEGVEVDTQGDAFFCAFPTAAGLPRRRSLPRSGCAPGRSPTHRDADGNDRGLRGDRRAPRRASGGARSGGQRSCSLRRRRRCWTGTRSSISACTASRTSSARPACTSSARAPSRPHRSPGSGELLTSGHPLPRAPGSALPGGLARVRARPAGALRPRPRGHGQDPLRDTAERHPARRSGSVRPRRA